jgi:hypothetical protein
MNYNLPWMMCYKNLLQQMSLKGKQKNLLKNMVEKYGAIQNSGEEQPFVLLFLTLARKMVCTGNSFTILKGEWGVLVNFFSEYVLGI